MTKFLLIPLLFFISCTASKKVQPAERSDYVKYIMTKQIRMDSAARDYHIHAFEATKETTQWIHGLMKAQPTGEYGFLNTEQFNVFFLRHKEDNTVDACLVFWIDLEGQWIARVVDIHDVVRLTTGMWVFSKKE